jgi:type IV pilus assembly protein PilM
LNSLASSTNLERRIYQNGLVRKIDQWLNIMPHSPLVVEIASGHVAAARWGGTRGHLESCALEALQLGSVMPSPVETNITQPDAVRSALRAVFARVPDHDIPLALLIPDPVVRVFILPFDSLPRRIDEALPLLRWRLKKSLPFDVEETAISWTRQAGAQGNLEIVTAVARRAIIREYEELVESLGGRVSIVLSSTLATLPLLEERGATLLIRMCGKVVTIVVVHGANLCVYRVTEMATEADVLETQSVLDEIIPAIAYYQDTWGSAIDRVRLAGFGSKERALLDTVEEELKVSAAPLTAAEQCRNLPSPATDMLYQNLDALVGWTVNGGI